MADKLFEGVRGLTGCSDVRERLGADVRDNEFLLKQRAGCSIATCLLQCNSS